MKFIATILISLGVTVAMSQPPDCRDLNSFFERLYKHEMGSVLWQHLIDSALQVCPDNPKVWGHLATANMIRGQFVEGMKYLDKAAELDPLFYLGNRAWYHMRYLHDYEGAIKDFNTLEKNAGTTYFYVTNIHMYMLKGLAYKELGEKQKALDAYNVAINDQVTRSGPDWVGTYDYLFRGTLRFQMGDMDGSIEDLTLQVKEYESLADTYYYRGLAYAAVGRKDEARADLEHAKQIMLGNGEWRWDNLVVLPDQVYLSDVENALLKLY
jgi:tetratricopeptide (TPR) repeat protein